MELSHEDIKTRPLKLRDTPFAWQDTRMTKFIRQNFKGKKLTTALAIYQTMTDLASNAGRMARKHVNKFHAHLEKIGEKSGKSVSTIKRYVKEFRSLKILSWERRKNGKMNLSNLWILYAYSAHYHKLTSIQDKELNPSGHHNELAQKEALRKLLYNKDKISHSKTYSGFKSVGDIVGDNENNELL